MTHITVKTQVSRSSRNTYKVEIREKNISKMLVSSYLVCTLFKCIGRSRQPPHAQTHKRCLARCTTRGPQSRSMNGFWVSGAERQPPWKSEMGCQQGQKKYFLAGSQRFFGEIGCGLFYLNLPFLAFLFARSGERAAKTGPKTCAQKI